ncbi:ABC transporter substrate-binding protein [Rhodococcus sp. H36-A4]|uniref:ABC transporter substrate-binding protein n=1 Tax=Rhodococcus sp. H36-A4 TaxID=3004353 RepID=UPI0022B00AF7|nr:ABC transporter substrate-binding protein [Rhodococcus sp. H36-A4]MCZ4077538.1 ABC transporter substrate-binding protein [Rhodococcus sp. H36-A4]
MSRRFPDLILAGATTLAVVMAVVGCTANTDSSTLDNDTTADGSAAGTVSIVDHTGNEVSIPSDIQRVAFDEIPLASTYVAYQEGSAPHLVGMSDAVVRSLENTVVAQMAPEILDVDTSYYDNGELNVETLLTLEPDVVFYNANNTEHAQMFAAAGIPAVGFSTSGNPTVVYKDWLELLEKVFQEPGKMDSVIARGEQTVADTLSRTSNIAGGAKKDALIVYNYAAGTLRVAGETPFFGYYWLETAGADNAAVGAQGGLAAVTAEQILAWDPDVVLIGGSGPAGITPDQVLSNSVDGLNLSSLRAVQEKKVYSTDLGMWSWFTPNPDAPLVTSWLGKVIYPDEFSDVDLVAETQDYYRQVYGYELSGDQANAIYQGLFSNE